MVGRRLLSFATQQQCRGGSIPKPAHQAFPGLSTTGPHGLYKGARPAPDTPAPIPGPSRHLSPALGRSYLTCLDQTAKKVGCGGSGRQEGGGAHWPHPLFGPNPCSCSGFTSLFSPGADLPPSTPYSALMSVLFLPTPGIFVLRTRVKFTCPYPFFWCKLY